MTTQTKLSTAELLFGAAKDMGLCPSWLAYKGPFVVTIAGEEQYINFARSPLNSHVSASLAADKFTTRLILERNNLPNIAFARVRTQAEAETFLHKYGKIIVKPLKGSGSRGIHIVDDAAQMQDFRISDYILEEYCPGIEMRYLILNGEVIAMYHSDYGTSVKAGRAARCVAYPRNNWDADLVARSTQIADILGLRFAAVDYLIDTSGQARILEVNTAPDLMWFHAPADGPTVEVARLFLEAIVQDQLPPSDTFINDSLNVQVAVA